MVNSYIVEMFEPTLLIGLFVGLVGISAAFYYKNVNLFLAFLAVFGAVLAQMAVNLIDDYADYSSGIDKDTTKTKFSGGSELLTSGKIKPKNVLYIGIGAVAVAAIIGIYLAYIYPIIIPLIVIGAIAIFGYAKYVTKIPFLTEPMVMFSFLVVAVGCFIVAHGSTNNLGNAFYALIPAGMPGGIALLINSVPDRHVDKKHGRRNGVIMLDKPSRIAYYYLFFELVIFASLISGMLLKILPVTFLIVFLTIPIVYKVFIGIQNYKDPRSYEWVMGTYAMKMFIFLILLSVAYVI
jgi:1,4-dihydroxy-2-naphthoate polyprenyltransferase